MGIKIIANNKKAYFNYEILWTVEAGISLTGPEVKSIRQGDVSINESFVLIRKGQAQILNMYITKYSYANYVNNLEPDRTRILLLHKKEINKLLKEVQTEKVTLVPTKIYWKDNKIKLEIGVGKGKNLHDKRQTIKERELSRKVKKNKY